MSKAEKEVIVPSDPVSREKIKKALQSIGDEWAIIEGHKAVIKETIDAVAEEHELPKKFVRKLAKTMYMQNFKNQERSSRTSKNSTKRSSKTRPASCPKAATTITATERRKP